MNLRAARLGMEHSRFANPSGLNAEGHCSTARDLALLARACLKNETLAAIAATRCLAPVTIIGAQCVAKSYPNFWEDYEALGGQLIRSGAEKGESV